MSIFQKRQTRYSKKTPKFGIGFPKTVSEDHELDKMNGNTLWGDEISKENNNVEIAFDIMPDEELVLNGYKHIRYQMIFDVKIEDFRRNAILVADGNMEKTPKFQTYYIVISCDTVRLALTISALNDFQIKAGYIMNSYVTAPTAKKVWTVLGNQWGANAGNKAIIVHALYGLKNYGADLRKHLDDCMIHVGYKPCPDDLDRCIKPEVDTGGNIY